VSRPAVDELVVASPDPERLAGWYGEVFGTPSGLPAGLRIEAGRIHASRAREPMRLVPTVAVADAAAIERRLIGVGATWLRELEATAWGRIATVLDPDGNCLQIIETRSAP
jgi:hypothetical protein